MPLSWSHKTKKGVTLVAVLVLAGVFLMMLQGAINLFLIKHTRIKQKQARVSAFHVAEGDLAYWRWRFAHLPNDPQQTRTIARAVNDFRGGVVAQTTITIDPPSNCNSILSVTAKAVPTDRTDIQRTVNMQYGKPSLAKYSFLTNSNIWFAGSDGTLDGELFANGGIRLDTEQNAVAHTSRTTYACGPEHGCQSPSQTKPGIWGSGTGGARGLWSLGETNIDFESIPLDLKAMADTAQAAGTLLPASGAAGWHLVLQSPNTVSVRTVLSKKASRWSYNGKQWVFSTIDIASERLYRTITIPENTCGNTNLLVAQDDVWVDGSFNAPLTIVAARFPDVSATNASLYLNGSITIPAGEKTKLALIGQKDVLVPLEVPNTMTINAVTFALHGHAFRNFYCPPGYLRARGYSQSTDQVYCPATNVPWYLRSTLTLNGSMITNGIAGFTWVDQNQHVIGGFSSGKNYFDSTVVFTPPPFFPTTDNYERIHWQDVTEKQ